MKSQPIDLVNETPQKARDFRVMFYNCENFFDSYDDSLVNDEEFLPSGIKHWTQTKFKDKIFKVSKVIIGAGGWHPVDIVCLAEIENRYVLEQLLYSSNLYKSEYRIIHKDSPDSRGIDVAILYREQTFTLLESDWFYVDVEERSTRDIQYVKGVVRGVDTLHVLVNHWPSRWGGVLESEHRRVAAAKVLRSKVDSLYKADSNTNTLIVGDFNDTRNNKSLKEVLRSEVIKDSIYGANLYDLTGNYDSRRIGTHKYQGVWSILDHIIVSGNLLSGVNNLSSSTTAGIYMPDYLKGKDEKHLGYKPFRTYSGYTYIGGYSDHFPVFVDMYLKE